MGNKVNFINISNDDYQNLENKNGYTFYKCYDTNCCYLGENEITNQEIDELVINLQKEVEQTQDTLQWNDIIQPYALNLTAPKIYDIIKNGKAKNYWSIGDKVSILLNGNISTYNFDNEVCYVYVIGFNHNKELETDGKDSVTFQFGKTKDDIDIAFVDPNYDGSITPNCGFQMNTQDTNKNGWIYSHMRSLCINFYQLLAQEWQDAIMTVTKYTNNCGQTNLKKYVTASSDPMFLLAEYEVCGVRTNANIHEQDYQQQYEYYSNGDKNIKYKSLDNESATAWWLRSPYYNDNYNFCYITDKGKISRYHANVSYGFAPAFVVA